MAEPKPPLFYVSELCWACLWEIACEKTEARLQNGKIGIKRKTVRRQRNVTLGGCSVWSCNCSSLSPILFLLLSVHPSLLYCRSFQPSLMLIYAAWLAQNQQGGVLSLDYQQWEWGVWEAGARVTWTDTSFNLIHWSMQQRGSWGVGGR